MSSLTEAIADCLATHAQAVEMTGSERPELDRRIAPALREKVDRQRAKVDASLSGDPDNHRRHVEALTKGLQIVLRRLGKLEVKPAKPPLPRWEAATGRWVAP